MTYKYNINDFATIANHVHQTLCSLDKGDRALGLTPKWHDLTELVSNIHGYHEPKKVRSLADFILNNYLKYIERKEENFDVRLTREGREQCNKRITV